MNSTQSGVYPCAGGYDIIAMKFALIIDATLPCPFKAGPATEVPAISLATARVRRHTR
jgi:hypothetical protein